MVLVPGPHFLNGALDLINGRVGLGAARLVYAGLIVVAISVGLLLGLYGLGVAALVVVEGEPEELSPGNRNPSLARDVSNVGS